jgi:hypothetical protein
MFAFALDEHVTTEFNPKVARALVTGHPGTE